jgi:hypothetical protein
MLSYDRNGKVAVSRVNFLTITKPNPLDKVRIFVGGHGLFSQMTHLVVLNIPDDFVVSKLGFSLKTEKDDRSQNNQHREQGAKTSQNRLKLLITVDF